MNDTIRAIPTGAAQTTTWKDVPTRTINAGGVTFAYRQVGPDSGVTLVFLHHFTAVLDDWTRGSSTASPPSDT
jgi:hypothetical protein